jgi:Uma2 family endonuclease
MWEWYDSIIATTQQVVFRPQEIAPAFSLTLPGQQRKGADWFYELCRANDDWQFEQTAEGEILMMAPAGAESGTRELKAATELELWARATKTGQAFGPSTGYRLPNGANRSPDASWVQHSRLAKFTARQRRKFLPLCPDFVVEILSPSDRLPKLQAKMEEYRENGARLGWLIDPERKHVYVYRPGRAIECLKRAKTLSADPELPGFVLDLAPIWKPF